MRYAHTKKHPADVFLWASGVLETLIKQGNAMFSTSDLDRRTVEAGEILEKRGSFYNIRKDYLSKPISAAGANLDKKIATFLLNDEFDTYLFSDIIMAKTEIALIPGEDDALYVELGGRRAGESPATYAKINPNLTKGSAKTSITLYCKSYGGMGTGSKEGFDPETTKAFRDYFLHKYRQNKARD